ncbi:MAG: pitrilysin family protein [Cyanobacteria bacterium J069]|nr:MAG: insulinase family protein [Cyanobacteria bacterium J069]
MLNSTLQPAALPLHRTVLSNGLVVLTTENAAADIVAARLFVRVGSRYEAPQKSGVSHLLTSVLTKGTARLSSMEIAEQIESVGASLGTDSSPDYCLLSLKTVSRDFAEMLKLAAELLRSPSFPESEVELEQRLTLQGIRSMQEQPFAVAQKQLRQAMYGDHPYALPGLGTEETVAQLSRADLLHHHQTHFRPDNLVISITGRITPEEAIALVSEAFGDWQAPLKNRAPVPLLSAPTPSVVSNPHRVATPQDTQQAIVMLGYLTPSVHAEDYMALKLLSTYLGNGLSSRLFVELREKQGLAYEVSAYYPTRLDRSQFIAYMGTAPGNVAIALEGLHREVSRLAAEPLSEDELQSAKNKLLGQYALGKQTNAQIAQIYGWYETLGLGIDFDTQFQAAIAQITPEAAQVVAQRYFTEPYVSLVGPASAVG